jgi:hypothetical protein
MADYRAIASVCEAVIDLLKSNYNAELFNHELQFKVYNRDDFGSSMEAGVSLFLYRIYHNGTHRSPPGRLGLDGKRNKTKLPLDIHFLLTSWARAASLQNTIAGWMMRIIEDTPILPSGLLNYKWNSFGPDETVEISLAQLSTEDVFRIWDTLIQEKYQISVPYLARNIRIDSTLDQTVGTAIRDREFQYEEVAQK